METFVVIVVLFILWQLSMAEDRKKRVKKVLQSVPETWRVDVPGSAKFLEDKKDLKDAGLWRRHGFLSGHDIKDGHRLRFDQDCHITVIAPSGAGKTTSLVIPNVLSMDKYSLFIMDSKCEIAPVTAEHRAKLGPVYILNPHEMNMGYLRRFKMAQYNPMARLSDPKEPKVNHAPIVEKIIDGSFMMENSSSGDAFFTGGGQSLFGGFIIWAARYGKPEERNLPFVRRMLSGDVVAHCQKCCATGDQDIRDLWNSSRMAARALMT